ncbi:hypothetical protein [Chitinophaga sp. CF418]|uniref:hypothetical protein n=1 Tax=Chitinophaga sp. CF418 TaxID=1855287 RepID=UPI0009161B47|nr:hypothetical protein [Chitinophaga sp. CF418]SHN44946.1 hypothetical protein SAMN05216311_118124 [Chitinophaga sp. CF418]
MKKALLFLLALSLLFGCSKNETSVVNSTPQAFDEAAFLKKVEEISANAIRKSSHQGGRGRFWKIIKIIASDIGGGITGALGGLELTGGTTAGGIIGGVAGAAAASIKAAEGYVATVDATSTLKANLKLAASLHLNTHVPPVISEINPFHYFGEFHNAKLALLTPNVTIPDGVTGPDQAKYHDSYNQSMLATALSNDEYFKPYNEELIAMGRPYTLNQYRVATRFVDIFAYDTDEAYYTAMINSVSSHGPFLSTSKTVYLSLFNTIEQLETIEEVEEYIVMVTQQVALGFPDDYPDKDIMLQTLAVAAYSADFWYTLNQPL